jgi:hypothetical protein
MKDKILLIAFIATFLLSLPKLSFLSALIFTVIVFAAYMILGLITGIIIGLLVPHGLIKSPSVRIKITAVLSALLNCGIIYYFTYKCDPYLVIPASVAIAWWLLVSYIRNKQSYENLKSGGHLEENKA